MENEKEKKGLLARLKPKKGNKSSCCCDLEIEEIKDEEKLEDHSADQKDMNS